MKNQSEKKNNKKTKKKIKKIIFVRDPAEPSEKKHDDQMSRLMNILYKLDKRIKVTTKEIAEEEEVDVRTIQRDIKVIMAAGFPLTSIKPGHYSFVEGFTLEKFKLTNKEAAVIAIVGELAGALGSGFKETFRGLVKKMIPEDLVSPYYIKITESINIEEAKETVKVIEEAIDETKKIEFSYLSQSGKKQFIVNPLRIIFFDGFWYLWAQAVENNLLVKFRIEKISGIKITNEYFDMPENIDMYLKESINIFFTGKNDKKVKLNIDKDVAGYFIQKKHLPYQKITKENKDGSIVVESMVGDYREIIPTILRWMPNVVVDSPQELKEEIKRVVTEYMGRN
jgi:predicted DNA-binding transcriptional regulator YafY